MNSSSPTLVFPATAPTLLPVNGDTRQFPVRRIFCVGRNYLAHVRELQNTENEPPFYFQHELELVVALHSGGLNIPVDTANQHIFGYAIGLDMTRRDRQNDMKRMQKPWEVSKSFEDSAPCGAITPVSQCGLLNSGGLRLHVNDQLRQSSDLNLLIWPIPKLIAALSEQVELAAGDLIYTGTPEGVGPVQRGDVLEAEFDGLSRLRVTIV